MKKRKPFHQIIVAGEPFQYIWSWPKPKGYPAIKKKPLFIFYDKYDNRKEIHNPLRYISDESRLVWFGKYSYIKGGRGVFSLGMKQANQIITKYLKGEVE